VPRNSARSGKGEHWAIAVDFGAEEVDPHAA